MNNVDFWSVLNAIASVAGIVWFLYGPWQSLIMSIARGHLFALRDDVFDMATRGEMDFGSPLYLLVRQRININIRFLHTLSWSRMLIFHVTIRPKNEQRKLELELCKVQDSNVRLVIERKLNNVTRLVMATMFFRSPLLMLATVIFLPIIGVVTLYNWNLIDPTVGRFARGLQAELSLESSSLSTA